MGGHREHSTPSCSPPGLSSSSILWNDTKTLVSWLLLPGCLTSPWKQGCGWSPTFSFHSLIFFLFSTLLFNLLVTFLHPWSWIIEIIWLELFCPSRRPQLWAGLTHQTPGLHLLLCPPLLGETLWFLGFWGGGGWLVALSWITKCCRWKKESCAATARQLASGSTAREPRYVTEGNGAVLPLEDGSGITVHHGVKNVLLLFLLHAVKLFFFAFRLFEFSGWLMFRGKALRWRTTAKHQQWLWIDHTFWALLKCFSAHLFVFFKPILKWICRL